MLRIVEGGRGKREGGGRCRIRSRDGGLLGDRRPSMGPPIACALKEGKIAKGAKKKKNEASILDAFVPDGRERMGRRRPDESPETWSLERPSIWFYRLEMFASGVDLVDLADARLRRLGSADLESLRSGEKPAMAGPFLVDYSPPGYKPWHEVVNDKWPWVIEVPQEPKEHRTARVVADLIANAVESALRITGDSFFFTWGPAVCQPSVQGSLQGQYGLLPRETDVEIPEAAKYLLSQEKVAELQQIWNGQLALTSTRAALAIRRFNLAYERRNDDDSLVDLWIGLEALFSESGTDINYKAAMRIAYYLGASPDERQSLFKDVKESYNVRSRLVHGDPLTSLSAARTTARNALRRALARSMKEKVLPDPGSLDFEIAAGDKSLGKQSVG
jgi:hypothetical protein